jgi:hypothetical protein
MFFGVKMLRKAQKVGTLRFFEKIPIFLIFIQHGIFFRKKMRKQRKSTKFWRQLTSTHQWL